MMRGWSGLVAAGAFAGASVCCTPAPAQIPSPAQAPAVAPAQAPAAAPTGAVKIQYGPATTSNQPLAHARDLMTQDKALEELQLFLTPLRLPRDLNIVMAECGGAESHAYTSDPPTVTICYERIAKILAVAKANADPKTKDETLVDTGAITETLLHETAYGIFDILHVPVWGRIDDAADELAGLIMLQFGEDAAKVTVFGTAKYLIWSSSTVSNAALSSAESPEMQRFYDFLCIALGGDQVDFGSMDLPSELIAPHRFARCSDEYQKVRKAFNLRIMPYIDPDLLVRARVRDW
jgi:hypothetical protein